MDSAEKLKRELEQLRDMSPSDASEVMQGYHMMFRKRISDCMEDLHKITDLSPATFRLAKTATIIAESDFLAEQEGEKLNHLYVEGTKTQLAKLFINIFKQCPDIFDEVLKMQGCVKA